MHSIKRSSVSGHVVFAVCALVVALILTACSVYNDLVLDNKAQTLPCNQLPTEEEVAKVLTDHQEAVQQILAVNPGHVFVDVDVVTCPSRAFIVISYQSHRDRVAIEEIIAGNLFFGVPYELRNQ